jgi:hypothetical protein
VTSYLRSARMVPIWVLLITLTLMVFAATQVVPATTGPTGMVAAFVDTNGNDIDDTCEDPATIVADPTAADAAEKAVDQNGDGTISVSEAAQSGRIGGKNCNHGGYVSWVAHGSCPDAATAPEPALVTGPALDEEPSTTCDEPTAEEPTTDESTTDEAAAPATECVEVPPPDRDPALDEQKNGHGKWVSTVAQSDAKGGKNCNHGGAVSEAAKKDHTADKAARDAAKAAKKAEREAAKLAAGHGKGKGKQH